MTIHPVTPELQHARATLRVIQESLEQAVAALNAGEVSEAIGAMAGDVDRLTSIYQGLLFMRDARTTR